MIESHENSLLPNQRTQSKTTPPNLTGTENSDNLNFRPIWFTGTAGEYWGIFIANAFLSAITFGIYSAWAKVRRKRYFLNCTKIDGIALNYHATGKQLFKGRLIVFAVIVVSLILTTFYPLEAGIPLAIFFLFLPPWVLNRSMKFNARVTSWRNVRFNWQGTYWKSFAVIWLSVPLAVLSFGILIPFISRWIYQYYVRRYSYGVTSFEENAALAPFVKAFLLLLPIVIILELIIFALLGNYFFQLNTGILRFLLTISAVVILIAAPILYRTMCRNIVVQSLALGDAVRFHSNLNPYKVAWILVTNYLVSIVSLGLLIPWAHVRIYRYLCNNTRYAFVRSADEFIDEEQEKMSSFGEEYADIEDVDFSL